MEKLLLSYWCHDQSAVGRQVKFVGVHQRNAAEPIKALTGCSKFTFVERLSE